MMVSTQPETPTYTIVRGTLGEAGFLPDDADHTDDPRHGLALIDLEDCDWKDSRMYEQAKVLVSEPTLDEAAREFQARCVADLGVDPVNLAVFSAKSIQIGSGLGLEPYDPV